MSRKSDRHLASVCFTFDFSDMERVQCWETQVSSRANSKKAYNRSIELHLPSVKVTALNQR